MIRSQTSAATFCQHNNALSKRTITAYLIWRISFCATLLWVGILAGNNDASANSRAPNADRNSRDASCNATEPSQTNLRQRKTSNKATQEAHMAAFAFCIQQVNWQAGVNKFVNTNGWIATPAWGITRPQAPNSAELIPPIATKFNQWRVTDERVSKHRDVVIQTGSWAAQIASTSSTSQSVRGHFLLIWQQLSNAPNQPIRIAFGLLTQNDITSPILQIESATATSAETISGRKGDAQTLAEIQFGGICGASGMSTAFDLFADNDIEVLREGGALRGKTTILADPRTKSERWRYIAQSNAIDAAHEIAFVFGRYNMSNGDNKTERGYFARVWKVMPNKDSKDFTNWRVMIDAASPQSRM